MKKNIISKIVFITLFTGLFLANMACDKTKPEPDPDPTPVVYPVKIWTTSADQASLLKLKYADFATAKDARFSVITVDTTEKYQTIDGFGYSLTGGSAYLINKMGPTDKDKLLEELFSNKATAIGVSYLRISLGASDLSTSVFSYNDLESGKTDLALSKFSLAQDSLDLIPVLKKIIAINPKIKIMASPWSAPTWMKTNQSSIGGTLEAKYFEVYAQYFLKYIQKMKAQGITIDAITLQNEPNYGGNNPSMLLSSKQAADFVKNNLGPLFKAQGITTKIIVWDHNCDTPSYPIDVMNDAAAKQYIDGSAFHLYGGDISALSSVHAAHPDKNLYFTEQWTGAKNSFSDDLKWHSRNVMIGSMRNRSRVALEWNLASDESFGPHTPGGCTECKGAVTIQGNTVTRNVGYYNVAQMSKFVPAGSVRIGSDIVGQMSTVAFRTPSGNTVLVILNEGKKLESVNISYHGKWIVSTVAPEAVATYVW